MATIAVSTAAAGRHVPGFSGEIPDELKIINKVIRLLTPG